jgi:hypothetical protein
MTEELQNQRLDKIEAELSALKTSTGYGFGELSAKLSALQTAIDIIAARPPRIVPGWFMLMVAIACTTLSAATLAIIVYLILTR